MSKLILAFIFIFLLQFKDCISQDQPIKGYIVYTDFPEIDTIINNQWEVRKYTPTFTKIFYFSDQVMIQQSFIHTNIEMANNEIVKQDPEKVVYYSFVFSNESNKGVLFDSSNIQTARVVNKDSLIKYINVLTDNVKINFETTDHQLMSSEIQSNGILEEKYSFMSLSDSSLTGHFILRFSGSNTPEEYYQISPSYENKRKMRLIEYIIISNARSFGEGELSIGIIKYPQRVVDIKVDNKQEIQKMFDYAKGKLK